MSDDVVLLFTKESQRVRSKGKSIPSHGVMSQVCSIYISTARVLYTYRLLKIERTGLEWVQGLADSSRISREWWKWVCTILRRMMMESLIWCMTAWFVFDSVYHFLQSANNPKISQTTTAWHRSIFLFHFFPRDRKVKIPPRRNETLSPQFNLPDMLN